MPLIKTSLKLTSAESRLLFDKYCEMGLTVEESNERVRKVHKYLKQLSDSFKTQNKTSVEINEAFYNEYEKLLNEAETGRFD